MKQRTKREQERAAQRARLNARYDACVEIQDAIRERIEMRSTVMYCETAVEIRVNMTPEKREKAERLRKYLFHKNNEGFQIYHIVSKIRIETAKEMKTNEQY